VTVQPQSRGALTFSAMISHYLAGEKKKFCQVIRVQPVHNLKVLQRSSDFDCYPILSKFEIT